PTVVPPTGITQIPLTVGVDGLMFVPTTYKASRAAPVALLFHGAGADASELIGPISTYAESRGLVLVAVTSTQATWDAITGVFGADVRSADAALNWLFARIAVDTTRLGVMGFSDGGTYSIAIARAHGA